MESAHADLLTGRMLDRRYHVRSRIAHGGMATVYLATDTRLDREVALKVMHTDLARDAEFVDRFIGEAKSVARLSHPNITAVYDQGADGQYLYLAMEYVPGRTLRALLRERGWLPPTEALALLDPVLSGLAAAHQAGIVHRDVKPENVLIAPDGRVKVVDFGLARAAAAVGNTRAGVIMGSVGYIAPEQVTGAPTDARTDVYSAGIVLFEMLTGRQPFTGETPIAVAYAHVNSDVPPVGSLVAGFPPAVDQLVRSATSRDPQRRPANAAVFLRVVRTLRGIPEGSDPASLAGGLNGAEGGGAAGVNSNHSAEGAALSAASSRKGVWGDGVPPYGGVARGVLPPGGQGNHTMVVGAGYPGGSATGFDGTGTYGGSLPGVGTNMYGGGYGDGYGGPVPVGPGYAGEEREPFLQRWLFSRRLAYVAIAAAAVIGLVGGGWYLASGRYTNLPSVSGMTASAATQALVAAGFKVVDGTSEIDNSVAKGDVISTSPAGRALPGATVMLTLSLGPRMLTVPTLPTTDTVAQAMAALRADGFTVSPAPKPVGVTGTVVMGAFAGTDPAAGTSWPQNKPVAVEQVAGLALPDLVGQNIGSIQSWAGQNRINIQPTNVQSSRPQGVIVSQATPPGTPVQPGQTVDVSVSEGPPEVQIPGNLVGENFQQVQSQLETLGFKVVGEHVFFGQKVVSISPSGQAPQGSTITVTYGL